ncbi:hypothetical protein CBL_12288 [Carabus blaptoides fortunei]
MPPPAKDKQDKRDKSAESTTSRSSSRIASRRASVVSPSPQRPRFIRQNTSPAAPSEPADLVDLDNALRAWTHKILPSRQSPRQQKSQSKGGRRGPPTRTTPPTNRRQERAAAYKKCQDLYRHKRSLLANNIMDGTSPSADEDAPSLKDVEDFYTRIFENPSPLDDERFTAEPHIAVHLRLRARTSRLPSAPGSLLPPDLMGSPSVKLNHAQNNFSALCSTSYYTGDSRRPSGKNPERF